MKFLLAFLLLSGSVKSYSCSCWGPQDFCTATGGSITEEDFVILGKKIDDLGHGMEVEVLKSYGKKIEKEKIVIWGDLGWLCRTYTSGFTIGDTFFFNLDLVGEAMAHPLERAEDYTLSVCGLHYLFVKNETVTGFINHSQAVQTVDLETLDFYLETNDCASLEADYISIDAVVSPNPFEDNLLIRTNHKISELELYDMTGRLILRDSSQRFYYRLNLYDYHLFRGMYILRIVGYMSDEKIIKIIKV